MKNRLSSIFSASLGNILEWYDFGLFSIYSSLFSRIFFPQEDPKVALIATFSIFAVGFLCRPIGALIFGYLGDKQGRASTLRLSILMIALPTLLIGCLPTYSQIGILAPLALTVIRMWQGISIGGEYSGNLIYLAETAPDKYRATFTSLGSTGANIGLLFATVIGMVTTSYFTPEQLATWGWRLPYLASGILCVFIYFFRLHIAETNTFEYLRRKHLLVANPLRTVFQRNRFELLRTVGLVCMGSTLYYFSFVYIPLYLKERLHYSIHEISVIFTILFLLMVFLVPLCGLICDRVGRRRLFLFNVVFVMLAVLIGFWFLQSNVAVVMVLLTFTLACSLEQATTSITVVENFPLPARYTGLSFGYNLGNGILGGTVPLICAWLATTAWPLAPAWYITACAFTTGLVVFFFVPETYDRSLMPLTDKDISVAQVT